ncbi:hypothetical protein SAMN05443999_104239 [Roseovarius azorensis]|uniref:Uncharacterized protein n=1 Tax=Roseovarius azorensis TaxID=1287727 RepID=A0A1H7NX19_9RHOB|nr:hypothetical protein [Roseovarius azorensis]SEL27427.1 hypothetical protein SAMN05443999_104239 [Roseovarius azorensis]
MLTRMKPVLVRKAEPFPTSADFARTTTPESDMTQIYDYSTTARKKEAAHFTESRSEFADDAWRVLERQRNDQHASVIFDDLLDETHKEQEIDTHQPLALAALLVGCSLGLVVAVLATVLGAEIWTVLGLYLGVSVGGLLAFLAAVLVIHALRR